MSQTTDVPQDFVDDLVRFFRQRYRDEVGMLAQKFPNDQRSIEIDYHEVYRFDPDVAEDLKNHPDDFIELFEEALGQYDLPVDIDLSGAHVRVKNLPDTKSYSVGGYRSDDIGNLIAVSGQVAKRTDVKPKLVVGAFECQRCGTMTRIPQSTGEYQEPHECSGCERQGPFKIKRSKSEWKDHQQLRVQQPPEEVRGGQGANVDVHIADDLVQQVESGDRVTVTGIMSVEEPDGDSITFDPYIEGQSIEVEQTDYDEIDVDEHLDTIRAIANGEHGDPYQLLVDSIAPGVFGMDEIKEALALQLFGGLEIEYPDGSTDRGDSHILLMGDPGTAKSTLLEAIEEIAPRGTFASGKGATPSGMTAAAVRDDFGDTEWGLEAGALVLANNGIACVDEIDKVTDEAVNSMHEALESQRVNINKAGINTTLPAKTALLAAGNPKHGRLDQYQPNAEQIDLDPALMSRFDLMFIVDDKPDEEEDSKVTGGVLDNHQTGAEYTADPKSVSDEQLENIQPEIDTEVLRAYVAHAKQTVQPRISDSVKHDLRKWFVNLRLQNGETEDAAIPVTFRKLEAILRLAEASARVRLSNTVSHDDLERAKRLVLRSMEDVGMDPETGDLDADIIETGMSKSQRDRVKSLKTMVEDLEQEYDKGAPHDVLLEKAQDAGMEKAKVMHEIEKLKHQGEIYEPQDDHYRAT